MTVTEVRDLTMHRWEPAIHRGAAIGAPAPPRRGRLTWVEDDWAEELRVEVNVVAGWVRIDTGDREARSLPSLPFAVWDALGEYIDLMRCGSQPGT